MSIEQRGGPFVIFSGICTRRSLPAAPDSERCGEGTVSLLSLLSFDGVQGLLQLLRFQPWLPLPGFPPFLFFSQIPSHLFQDAEQKFQVASVTLSVSLTLFGRNVGEEPIISVTPIRESKLRTTKYMYKILTITISAIGTYQNYPMKGNLNQSSNRRQPIKKVIHEKQPIDVKPIDVQPSGSPEVENDVAEIDDENTNDEEQLSPIRLDDLIAMIKNAEKNILLLNHARIRALDDLDKILNEKEDLQGQINILEIRLAETDARIKVAAQEKIHVELLESQFEKLKHEMSEGHDENMNAIDLAPVSEELDTLRKENASLKEDIQELRSKLTNVMETDERVFSLEKERFLLRASVKDLESRLVASQEDVSKLAALQYECKALWEKVESLQELLENATKQADQTITALHQSRELQWKVDRLEGSLEEANSYRESTENSQKYSALLQQKVKLLEERLQRSDEEIHSHVQLYQESVKEFQDTLNSLKEEREITVHGKLADDMPWQFWSRLLLMVDGWLLEKKISANEAKLLREMAWKRDGRLRDAYLGCKTKNENDVLSTFLKLTSSRTRSGLHVIHIAAEMAPIAKVGGLGDVVTGLGKALQKKGHLVEIVLPKYDCMQYDRISDLKALDVVVQSYFDGQLFPNKIWAGTIEGAKFSILDARGQFYGEKDDFKRFSFFSRAALELLHQAGKKPDIIHCHDWQTAFVAPLYWDVYAPRGFNSARMCFTCHNFEYQGTSRALDLASCGLDVHQMNRPDRMQDNASPDRVNPVKGAIVFSNIVTTVSPSYAQEVRTSEGGRGLHGTLNAHSKKFVGILNGIDTDAWNPSTDSFLRVQYSADDLQGKAENKGVLRKQLNLSSANATQPLVGCITRLVPQKGVHLIRHAIYRTLELGGQFVLLGSSPVSHIQVLSNMNTSSYMLMVVISIRPEEIREEMFSRVFKAIDSLSATSQKDIIGDSIDKVNIEGVIFDLVVIQLRKREFEDIANHFKNSPHIRLILKYDDALSHSIYAASDMFIIPSIFEPCGLTQMIAMRYGSVPIVRRTGGLNDSVFDVNDDTIPSQFRNGFTFGNPDEQGVNDALERAFNHYMQNNESWLQLVQKNMKIDFSWDSSATQYEDLYEKSVARARALASLLASCQWNILEPSQHSHSLNVLPLSSLPSNVVDLLWTTEPSTVGLFGGTVSTVAELFCRNDVAVGRGHWVVGRDLMLISF
ncbi:putative starch synthase 4, chloroplastic/amyloplastic [Asimina triloba]